MKQWHLCICMVFVVDVSIIEVIWYTKYKNSVTLKEIWLLILGLKFPKWGKACYSLNICLQLSEEYI